MRRPATALLALVAVLVMGPVLVDCSIHESELLCEDAVALLASCCPSLDPRTLVCPGDPTSCEPPPPSFSIEESRCLRALDCAAIRARGICELAAARAMTAGGATRPLCE
jgi:hypothetical protein